MRLYLFPQPPPPGVSILRISPFPTSKVVLGGITFDFLLLIKIFLPLLPDFPPRIPYGAKILRSVIRETVALERNLYPLTIPSPPLYLPSPPLPLLMEYASIITGSSLSIASIGVL